MKNGGWKRQKKKRPNSRRELDGMEKKYKEVHSVKTLVQLKLPFLVFPLDSVQFFFLLSTPDHIIHFTYFHWTILENSFFLLPSDY